MKKIRYSLMVFIIIIIAIHFWSGFIAKLSYEEVSIVRKTENSIVVKNYAAEETEILSEKPAIQLIDQEKKYMVSYEDTLLSKPYLISIELIE